MAKKKTVTPKNKELVDCITCDRSELMQWGNDPIIASCEAKHSREVARVKRPCEYYNKSKRVKQIKKFKKTYGF